MIIGFRSSGNSSAKITTDQHKTANCAGAVSTCIYAVISARQLAQAPWRPPLTQITTLLPLHSNHLTPCIPPPPPGQSHRVADAGNVGRLVQVIAAATGPHQHIVCQVAHQLHSIKTREAGSSAEISDWDLTSVRQQEPQCALSHPRGSPAAQD